MFGRAFAGKRVWLSGATGFKGAWLTEWLLQLGASVATYSLPPATEPSLFRQLDLEERSDTTFADVRDPSAVEGAIIAAAPDYVFHLAAQPLVRQSYADPLETYSVNVMGTAHVLNALRQLEHPCAAVIVTTDKCYENREWIYGYREEDPLGGYDPYSSSKAAAEIVTSAYRRSFFLRGNVRVASARAGNVIGGGDWSADRIVPDCIKALARGEPIRVRHKTATRPWQHVLEPLSGYLSLAARIGAEPADSPLCSAFNFGPNADANRTVLELVQTLLEHQPGEWIDASDPAAPHEAGILQLATDKARALLGWSPVWSFRHAVEQTVAWYRSASAEGADIGTLTRAQIDAYSSRARDMALPWAVA